MDSVTTDIGDAEHLKSKTFNWFIDLFLLTMGVLENPKYKNFQLPFFLIYFGLIVLDTFGMVVGFATTSDLIEKAIQFGQLITQINCIVMMLYFKYSMKLVLLLIAKLRANQTKWPEAEIEMEKFIKKFILKAFFAYYFAVIVTVFPIFIAQLSSNEISEKYSYVTPFWYSCGTNEKSIFRQFCWKVENSFELLVSNIIQAFTYYCTLHALIMLLLFYTVLTNNVRIHAKILAEKANEMELEMEEFRICVERGTENWKVRDKTKKWDTIFLEKFDALLQYQQFLKSFAKEVTQLVHWMVMINMVGIFNALSLTAFFTIIEKTNDSFLSSKMASMSIVMTVTFYIYCFSAQTISDLDTTLINGMLNIPWHQQTLKFRKKYAIAICLNQMPMNVKAGGMFEVNLRLYRSFMRALYSVLNVMLLKYS